MRKILCLVIVSLFCLSSFLSVVNSIYIEKGTNNFDFDKISYQEYSRTSKNDNAVISIDTYSKVLVGSQDSLLQPKTVYGTAIKDNGQSAYNAFVLVRASGFPDKTTNVLQDGAWRVDVTGWPDGTLFNVTITIDDLWQGFKESVVQGHLTNVGEVVLSPTTLIVEPYYEKGCYMYGDKVQFYGNAYGGEPPYSWSWDFGDSGTSLLQNPIHHYIWAGTYNACLTVIDNSGYMNTTCIIINVNDSVTADAGGYYYGDICNSVHFFGLYNGGCPPYSYSWDFDDNDGIQEDSTEQNSYHYYDTPGMYIASFTVSDGNGDSHTDTTSIIISSECNVIFPWPMKSQNLHHTGLSPFSTKDNNGMVKWKYEIDNWILGGIVIDNEGVLYFGGGHNDIPYYICALYPNGTLKWKFKTNNIIWSTPAIDIDRTIYIGSWDCKLYALFPDGSLKWKTNCGGSISSSPAIGRDGTVYLGTFSGKTHGGRLVALNPNGTIKWRYETGYHIVSDPAIADDGTIYIGSGDYYFYAMYPNGTLKWRFKTGDIVKSHPAIGEDGTVYFDSFDGYLYALYPNGTLRWKNKGPGCGCAGVAIDEDGIIYAGGAYLTALYPNGTMKWRYTFGRDRYSHHSSPAISADGTIYIGVSTGDWYAGYIFAINRDGTLKWQKKISNFECTSSPAIDANGNVYIGSSSSIKSDGDSYGELYAFGRNDVNQPPEAPVINGRNIGFVNKVYLFNFTVHDPELDDIELFVDWGDGNTTGWLESYDSGTVISLYKCWSERGNYQVKAKARDTFDGSESNWGTLSVMMPKTYIHNPILQLIMKLLSVFLS